MLEILDAVIYFFGLSTIGIGCLFLLALIFFLIDEAISMISKYLKVYPLLIQFFWDHAPPVKKTGSIFISDSHKQALAVLMSEYYPYADSRDLGRVFEVMIEEKLEEEKGVFGIIEDGKYKTINEK